MGGRKRRKKEGSDAKRERKGKGREVEIKEGKVPG